MIRVSEVGRRSPPRMRPRTAAKKPSPTSGPAPSRPATAKQRKGMPLGESVSVAVLEALAAQETHMATTNAIAKPHAQWQQASMRPQKNRKNFATALDNGPALPPRARSPEKDQRLPRPSTAPARDAADRPSNNAASLVAYKRGVEARRKTAVAALGDLARAAAAGGVPSAYHLLTGGSNSSAVSPALGSSRVSHSPAPPSFRAIHDAPWLSSPTAAAAAAAAANDTASPAPSSLAGASHTSPALVTASPGSDPPSLVSAPRTPASALSTARTPKTPARTPKSVTLGTSPKPGTAAASTSTWARPWR